VNEDSDGCAKELHRSDTVGRRPHDYEEPAGSGCYLFNPLTRVASDLGRELENAHIETGFMG
jgi:hypothetical protein